MEYISKTLDFHVKEPSVISFGKFDGLHRGHEFLMEKQIEQSNLHGYKRIIFTFDIPPKSEVLGVESKVIITNDEKEYVFEKSGIDYLDRVSVCATGDDDGGGCVCQMDS